ncbi:hypothetical protein SNF32_10070 [Enterococcus mundtii]|nr:hypothetical protein [Enterococcus mundtii]
MAEDWFPLLKEQPEKEAQTLALDLELYIDGSLSMFSKPTNVSLNKRFVIYNTKQLGNQLKTFGMMVVLEQVWNRVVRNRDRGITTWIYIDEMQLLLNDPYCENYFLNYGAESVNGVRLPLVLPKMSKPYYYQIKHAEC